MMGSNHLYLDCEWADVFASELVSIALVSLNGKHEFYAERAELPEPTPWVQAVVFPLLERENKALSDADMTRALRSFFASIEAPVVHFDYGADRMLCQQVLDGFGQLDADALGPKPQGLRWQLLTDMGPTMVRWWNAHPEEHSRRHHALVDARALRAAVLSLWGA